MANNRAQEILQAIREYYPGSYHGGSYDEPYHHPAYHQAMMHNSPEPSYGGDSGPSEKPKGRGKAFAGGLAAGALAAGAGLYAHGKHVLSQGAQGVLGGGARPGATDPFLHLPTQGA